jgi:hypothetical protein
MDMTHRIIRMHDELVDLGWIEMEDARLAMVDPDHSVKMSHGMLLCWS